MLTVSINWTDENVAKLKDLFGKDLSCAQIGARLGISRNAIIGKAHRLGLPRRGNQYGQQTRLPRNARPRMSVPKQPSAPTLSTHWGGSLKRKIACAERTKVADALPIEAPPQPRGDRPTLVQLKVGECTFSYGDPRHSEFHFCANPTRNSASFCDYHHSVCYVRAATP